MSSFQEKIKQKAWNIGYHPFDVVAVSVVEKCYAEDQKEDQEIRASLAKTCTDLNDKLLECEREFARQLEFLTTKAVEKYKQKLQRLLDEFPNEATCIYWTSSCDDEIQDEFLGKKYFEDMAKWKKKFEELKE